MPRRRPKDDERRFRELAEPRLRNGEILDCDALAAAARVAPTNARAFARRLKRELGYKLALADARMRATARRIATADTTATDVAAPLPTDADEPEEDLPDAKVHRRASA